MKVDSRTIRRLAGSTIFSITFVKRTTGEARRMICRLGCTKGVSGMGAPYDFEEKGLLAVYDVQRNGWRCIPLDAVLEIKVRGEIFKKRETYDPPTSR